MPDAYVVCPLVSLSDKDQAKAATAEAERLAAGEFSDFTVAVLHGQMSSARQVPGDGAVRVWRG